jgi:uncharacterized membrane protein YfcA
MLESFPFSVAIGVVLGFLSGLGIGGGSLLILWLTLVLGADQEIAKGINLLFFIPSAVIACFFRFRQGKLDLKSVLPAMAAGIISSIVFSFLGSNINTELLRKPFGILLLITGLREICYRPRKAK